MLKKKYEDYNDIEGPFEDNLGLHVHRYINNMCVICNDKKNIIKISTTKETSAYELNKKILNEHLKNIKSHKIEEKYIDKKYNYV